MLTLSCLKALETFFLADLFSFDSPRRIGFRSSGDTRGRCESIRESVFQVLRLDGLPTPIFTTLFSYAPQNERELLLIVHFTEKSILRKWVYSFKRSGISRGGHRGPEKVSSDRRSGRKMSDFRSITG